MVSESESRPSSSGHEKNLDRSIGEEPLTTQDDLTNKHLASSEIASPLHYPFPAFIQAISKWEANRDAFKTFKLCGKDENDILYIVELNLGFKSGGVLDDRPGLILRNGTTLQAPVIAAACHQSINSLSFMDFDTQSIILLPKLSNQAGGPIHRDLVESRMLPHLSPSKNITLRFSVEVGENGHRETFEWRKCRAKGIVGPSGFRLYHASIENSTKSTGSASLTRDDDRDILAEVTWTRAFSSTKLLFKLEFKGDGLTASLGERWSLAVVITASKIWMLRLHGKLTKRGIKLAEQIRKALEEEGLAEW